MPIDVYTGVAPDGSTVTVLAGAPLDAQVFEAATKCTGFPLGAPRPGAVLTRVAEMEMTPVLRHAEPIEAVAAPPVTVEQPAPPAPVTKRVQLLNAAAAQIIMRSLVAKAAAADAPIEEQGLATGIVMEPGVTDTQGQVSTAADVEKAMIYWACNGGAVDLMHSFAAIADERVDVVENWICRAPFAIGTKQVQPGTWLCTTKWQTDGKYWAAIKAGELNAYSIGGLGTTVPIEAAPAEEGA